MCEHACMCVRPPPSLPAPPPLPHPFWTAPHRYGCYVFDANTYLVSGFLDGSGASYGVVAYSDDGGSTWGNDTKIDATTWGGGPIEFANTTEGYMPSTSGASAWRTHGNGRTAAEWQVGVVHAAWCRGAWCVHRTANCGSVGLVSALAALGGTSSAVRAHTLFEGSFYSTFAHCTVYLVAQTHRKSTPLPATGTRATTCTTRMGTLPSPGPLTATLLTLGPRGCAARLWTPLG